MKIILLIFFLTINLEDIKLKKTEFITVKKPILTILCASVNLSWVRYEIKCSDMRTNAIPNIKTILNKCLFKDSRYLNFLFPLISANFQIIRVVN